MQYYQCDACKQHVSLMHITTVSEKEDLHVCLDCFPLVESSDWTKLNAPLKRAEALRGPNVECEYCYGAGYAWLYEQPPCQDCPYCHGTGKRRRKKGA